MLEAYRKHVEERANDGLPPLPLDAQQVADLIELIKQPAGRRRMSKRPSWQMSPGETRPAI